MRVLAIALIVSAFAWPVVLGAATYEAVEGRAPEWSAVVYAAASKVCHQRPERSFHTAGVRWPVCGRCSGLYLAAPVGALAAGLAIRRRALSPRQLRWLMVAAAPTALTLIVEWSGMAPVSNLERALAALPLGAMIAFVIVRTAAGES